MHLPRSGRRMNKTAIAFGTFDGVHRGHQEIINAMLTAAERRGSRPASYTPFPNHPAGAVPASPFSTTTTDGERLAALERPCPRCGGKRLDRQLAATEPEDFVRHMAEKIPHGRSRRGLQLTPSAAGGRGTWRRFLPPWGKYGFEVDEIPALMYGGEPVSSTADNGPA